jgi:hypothetical protein
MLRDSHPGGRALFAVLTALSIGSASAFVPHHVAEGKTESAATPLLPEYRINPDGSVRLRVCFNWSCARRKTLTFSAEDMANVKRQMAQCTDGTLSDRLQRIRIGIWQMELLAQKYLPVLANDRELNEQDKNVDGRTDCVDNASNTTTFLHIFRDIAELRGWSVESPRVRDLLRFTDVHWTAVVLDRHSQQRWSVDSWFRPHGHLPFVMPLSDWTAAKKGWEPPFDRFNPYPRYSNELCPPP